MRPGQLLKLCLLVTAGSTFAYAEAESKPEITIHVYDYDELDPRDLSEAEAMAANIFASAGVQILWGNCRLAPTGSPLTKCADFSGGSTHLYIRLLPEQMAQKLPSSVKMLGISLPTDDSSSPVDAYVLAERVSNLAKQDRVRMPPLLGAAIAHEVGHLLLAGDAHTLTGIMRAQWGPKENRDALMGVLRFSRKQSEKIRADVEQRMRGSHQRAPGASTERGNEPNRGW